MSVLLGKISGAPVARGTHQTQPREAPLRRVRHRKGGSHRSASLGLLSMVTVRVSPTNGAAPRTRGVAGRPRSEQVFLRLAKSRRH